MWYISGINSIDNKALFPGGGGATAGQKTHEALFLLEGYTHDS